MGKMKTLHVAISPLTNRIYAGTVLKDGCTWGAGKQDVTGAACGAVAEHVLENGAPVIVTCNGQPKYEIRVINIAKEKEKQK
jgi:hypothetical protein